MKEAQRETRDEQSSKRTLQEGERLNHREPRGESKDALAQRREPKR